jgi:hypothetical protein
MWTDRAPDSPSGWSSAGPSRPVDAASRCRSVANEPAIAARTVGHTMRFRADRFAASLKIVKSAAGPITVVVLVETRG